ncbi:MAG: hypothetical protein M3165_05245, partial [Actinomycetota bacterium]|nr:hypothetical protein [Actinomycetota bacterium]
MFVIAVQQGLHAHLDEAVVIHPLLHWLRDAALALPVGLAAVGVARAAAPADGAPSSRLEAFLRPALTGGAVFALLSVPAGVMHGRWFGAEHVHLSFLQHAVTDGMTVWMVAAGGLLVLDLLRRLPGRLAQVRHTVRRRAGGLSRPGLRRPVAVALSSALMAPTAVLSLAPAPAAAAEPTCPATRTYDVAAINVDVPYNRWGQVDNDGMVYVLQRDKAAVRNWDVPLDHVRGPDGTYVPGTDPAGGRRLRPRPLILRANAGDCVNVTLTNELNPRQFGGRLSNPRASIHVQGVPYNVQDSDGSAVGFNDDTTVAIGESITYRWTAPEEGVYLFTDRGSMAGSEADGGSTVHGLFGALAVEPAGSTWTDPVSGARLDGGTTGTTTPYMDPVTRQQSGELYIDADIHPPAAKSFRESVQLAHDEIPGIGFGFNYGSEPQEQREKALCPDCVGEETSLSSWAYGDPALVKLASGKGPWLPTPGNTNVEDCGLPGSCYTSNVTHAYRWDATKIRYGLAGVKETHVFHMHAHQWLAEPNDTGAMTDGKPTDSRRPESITVDSQTFGPGDMLTADLLYGAGSQPGTVGDSIFHCHLYPHFAKGFWALFRVHDVREDGTATTPDGIKVRNLQPLPGGINPPAATADNPGYPRFIPGEFGWRAPQAPGSVTEGGPNGTPATRIVAGRPLDAGKVAVERAVQLLNYGGAEPKAGAPLTDPCPAGAREVTYNVSVIQRDIVYNEGGWHDTQGRILVLDKDVDAVLAGTKEPEPLFIRVQSGDCINFNLTNRLPNWFGNDAFVKLTQTNMVGEHIHLVKFDVLGSDGASNGWNYQQAAFSKTQSDFNKQLLDGTRSCTRDEAQGACRLPLPADYDPTWSGQMPGQTIHQRWYADYELRTVFTHDHHFPAVDQNRGLYGALLVEPKGTDFRNPHTGEFYKPSSSLCSVSCEGDAAGASMDVIGPGSNDDFREFGLSFQDFVSLTKPGGNPQVASDVFNPPHAPEHFPEHDPGVMGINYRNAPFLLRDTKNGAWVDPAYRFSSTVFGDPKTPLLQAYAKDNVRIRLIGGSQEEQHIFALHGMRWRDEPDDPQSPLVNQRALGVSDALNFEIPSMDCGVEEDCQGDYLYSSTSTDATYLGMWGLMRVYGRGTNGLLPLPDNIPQATNGNTHFPVTGEAPPMANKPGTPCAPSAPVKAFHVIATDGRITYNKQGDHDPYGLMYGLVLPGETPEQAAARVRANPEPLAIRANEGDCLEVRLTNKIDPNGRFATEHAPKGAALDPHGGDPSLPLEGPAGTRAGLRVSLHPQVLKYDVRGSDGATVGFNRDQTVGPDQSILYRWWADDVTPGEIGATNLVDFGDVRGHRHHGLFAGLTIEPKNATYHDPYTGAEVASGEAADIRVPGQKDFREFTSFFQDGLNLRDASGAFIKSPVHDGEPLDAEDEGEKGFNYASEPFRHRIGEPVQATTTNPIDGQALARVFSSKIHGDPSTPIFRAYAG